MDRSWAMPQTPLDRDVTCRTDSPSVQEAQTPFFLNPETVSERMRTPSTGCFFVPWTQMPFPAFAQALAALVPAAGGMSTVPAVAPRRVRCAFLIRTLS